MAEHGFRKFIITVTCVSVALLELIDTSIVNVALPHIMGSLSATLTEVSWVVTGYIVANVIIIPLTDWFSSELGRKRYFLGSILLFVLASAFCGQATSITELVIFRILQGVGGAALITISRVILIETYPPEELGLANALFGLGAVVGPTIGPTLGGWLTDHLSWRWIFYVNLPVGIVAFVLSLLFITNADYEEKTKRVDWWGILFLVVGVGSLQTVLERGQDDDWFSSHFILALTAIAALGIILFIVRELTAEKPVVDLRVLRHPSLALGSIFITILGFGLYGSVFAFPVFTQRLLGYSALQTGLILLPGGIATAAMMPIVGVLLKRGVKPQILAFSGFSIFFIFCWMLSHLTMASGPGNFFWPLVIRGVGLGLLFVPLTTIAFTGVRGKELSLGSGLMNMFRQLGGSFGVALIGTFIERREAFHRTILDSNINIYNPVAHDRIAQFTGGFVSSGSALSTAHDQALRAIDYTLQQQSALMSYNDTFFMVGVFFLICLPLLLFTFRKKKTEHGQVAVPAVKPIINNQQSKELQPETV
ncbi:MAG TPA: DHA2 family efflux MFS transporter permease subunit [Balneolales bacterium]|nr:DHA2 family efflux MFS transporter permease subunit [Balneolales bacterium]